MNILHKIIEVKKEEVRKLRSEYPLSRFRNSELFERKTLSMQKALTADKDISIIAEIKKASPSKGLIRKNFNPLEIAETYFSNGANAVSILTDEQFFKGSLNYLREIAKIKETPLLRKDFIIDTHQIYEARANGADAILLIAEVLSQEQIRELTLVAKSLELEVLLELHSADQLEKIDFSLNTLIGVNNRNLENFSVDINRTLELCDKIPEHVILVSESGIHQPESLEKLKTSRTNAILVGEHLMRSQQIGQALSELKGWCRRAH